MYVFRPPNIVYVCSKGTVEFCLCCFCHNMERLLESSPLSTEEAFSHLFNPIHNHTADKLVDKIVCSAPTEDCYQRLCRDCSEYCEDLREEVLQIFEQLNITNVMYELWETTDRTQVVSHHENVKKFTDTLIEKLKDFVKHSFVNKEQTKFYYHIYNNLEDNEALICSDFSMNYIHMEAGNISSGWWRAPQSSIYTTMAYYRQDGEFKKQSFICISDSLKHEYSEVYAFHKKINEWFKVKLPNRKFTYYMSDGSTEHFKAGDFKKKNTKHMELPPSPLAMSCDNSSY